MSNESNAQSVPPSPVSQPSQFIPVPVDSPMSGVASTQSTVIQALSQYGSSYLTIPDINLNSINPGWNVIGIKPIRSIGAGLFFRYVKRGMTELRQQKLEHRLKRLEALRVDCLFTDQQGLLEAVERELYVSAKEQVLLTAGFPTVLSKARVEKYRGSVSNLKFSPLTDFPRAIPEKPKALLERARRLEVFDAFVVLYMDFTKEPEAKTTARKIREKDPIIFGVMSAAHDNLYFVADWVDPYCDLTLKVLADRHGKAFPSEPTNPLVRKVDDILKPEAMRELEARVRARADAVANTNMTNWREKERREALVTAAAAAKAREGNPPAKPKAPLSRWAKIKIFLYGDL